MVLVLLCLKMRYQGIETIGLKEGNIRLSFVSRLKNIPIHTVANMLYLLSIVVFDTAVHA